MCMLCLKYCPVGDHFGFQVGFLKQYMLFWWEFVVYIFCGWYGVIDGER